MRNLQTKLLLLLTAPFIFSLSLRAKDYHVGPGQIYTGIGEVPWESLSAGNHVFIHWRSDEDGGAYKEKWVINIAGTETDPFIVTGVLGPKGERPVIDGNGAVTRTELSYWGEDRSVIKVGGSGIPDNEMPSHITIENLVIRSAHPDYGFTDDDGAQGSYVKNAAALFIETGDHIVIRNCVIHDSGNGLFSAWESSNLLIEKNYIYGNGIVNSFYEHNAYTETTNIVYQFNRFGLLREGAGGNNLKDRSAGLVVRYNWIEGGNRLLDLVESDYESYYNNPAYRKTFVYGNILIEEDGGNPQVLHYGGDNGDETIYRKGKLYFYNNTLYSIRSGNTTLVRLSSNDESADIRNNILFVEAAGSSLALLDDTGMVVLRNNWMKPDWVKSHGGGISGTIDDDGSTAEDNDPGFVNADSYDFHLLESGSAVDKGTTVHPDVLPDYAVVLEYRMHQDSTGRKVNGPLDIGAYEYNSEIITGMTDPYQDDESICLYPNPVRGELSVKTEGYDIIMGKVCTMDGKTLFSFNKAASGKINVSGMGRGVYLLVLNTAKGIRSARFMKE